MGYSSGNHRCCGLKPPLQGETRSLRLSLQVVGRIPRDSQWYSEGFSEGFSKGFSEGCSEGCSEGFSEGCSKGFSEGCSEARRAEEQPKENPEEQPESSVKNGTLKCYNFHSTLQTAVRNTPFFH